MLRNNISPFFCQTRKSNDSPNINLDIAQLQEVSRTTRIDTISSLALNPSGTKLYLSHNATNKVEQFSLSVPWDVSSLTPDNKIIDFTIYHPDWFTCTLTYGITFRPDGAMLFVTRYNTPGMKILRFSLTAPWDISTAVYDGIQFTLPDRYYMQTMFSPDGTRMFSPHRTTPANILEHVLSTPWDVSTAVLNHTFDLTALDTKFQTIATNRTGTKIYVVGTGGSDKIFEISLSTPWDLSTAVYNNVFYYNAEITTYTGIAINQMNTNFYFISNLLHIIHLAVT